MSREATLGNLQRRDAPAVAEVWNNDAAALPVLPAFEEVATRLHRHAATAAARILETVAVRQLQEVVAVHHADPWNHVVNEAGTQTNITRGLSRILYDRIGDCAAQSRQVSPWHPVDIVAVGCYGALILAVVPLVSVHFLVKPIPWSGVRYLLLCAFLCVALLAGLQVHVHAGKEFLSSVGAGRLQIEDTRVVGLASVELRQPEEGAAAHDEAGGKRGAGEVSSHVARRLYWPELVVEVDARVACGGHWNDAARSVAVKFALRGVAVPLVLKVTTQTTTYMELAPQVSQAEAARRATVMTPLRALGVDSAVELEGWDCSFAPMSHRQQRNYEAFADALDDADRGYLAACARALKETVAGELAGPLRRILTQTLDAK